MKKTITEGIIPDITLSIKLVIQFLMAIKTLGLAVKLAKNWLYTEDALK